MRGQSGHGIRDRTALRVGDGSPIPCKTRLAGEKLLRDRRQLTLVGFASTSTTCPRESGGPRHDSKQRLEGRCRGGLRASVKWAAGESAAGIERRCLDV